MVKFSVLRKVRSRASKFLGDFEAPVLPRIGEEFFFDGHGYTVVRIAYEFGEDKNLKVILVEVYE